MDIRKITEEMEKGKANVLEEYRPRFHFTAPCGFINDPNGFTNFNGEWHLFYQYHIAGMVGWGHAKSKDLTHFTHLPPAVMPDEDYDRQGCWSGGAIAKDGKLYILYTGQNDQTEVSPQYECQCLAQSTDGITFEKSKKNPVIRPEQMTGDYSTADFRDPNVWKHGDRYYVILGNAKKEVWKGQLQLFSSSDLEKWEYMGVAYENPALGEMYECPSFVNIDEENDLLVFSPIGVPVEGYDYHNSRSNVYVLGKMDYESGKFVEKSHGEIDHGKDFYAAQVARDEAGVPVLIAWQANWGREYYTGTHGVGFENNMTLPRELSVERGKLVQKLYRKVEKSFRPAGKQSFTLNGKTEREDHGRSYRLKLSVDMKNAEKFALHFLADGKQETVLSYEKTSGLLTLDSSKSGYPTKGEQREKVYEGVRSVKVPLRCGKLSLDVFTDVSSVEVFAANGKETMSQHSFNDLSATGVFFEADGASLTAEWFDYE